VSHATGVRTEDVAEHGEIAKGRAAAPGKVGGAKNGPQPGATTREPKQGVAVATISQPAVVRLEDVVRHPSGIQRGGMTTAHIHVARFYQAIAEGHRAPSWRERIAAAPSPFAVEGLLGDFVLFGSRHASPKVRAQVFETARVRLCELRGVLP
jgi:hypothetical protein